MSITEIEIVVSFDSVAFSCSKIRVKLLGPNVILHRIQTKIDCAVITVTCTLSPLARERFPRLLQATGEHRWKYDRKHRSPSLLNCFRWQGNRNEPANDRISNYKHACFSLIESLLYHWHSLWNDYIYNDLVLLAIYLLLVNKFVGKVRGAEYTSNGKHAFDFSIEEKYCWSHRKLLILLWTKMQRKPNL